MARTPAPPNSKEALVVALTGSIGSGKSAAAELLRAKGVVIIDADILAREVVQPGTPALQEIASTFGSEFLLPSGELDRKKLGALVFSNPQRKIELEKITHPRIRTLFLERLAAAKKKGGIVVYVVPLLFESGFNYPEMDKIVVVTAPESVCLERVMRRDGISKEFAEKKFQSQLDQAKKAAKSDFVICNNGSLEDLKREVDSIYEQLHSL